MLKFILAMALVLPGYGAIARVNKSATSANGAGATATVSSLNCAGANLYFVVGVTFNNAAAPTDGQSHTFTLIDSTQFGTSSTPYIKAWYVQNVTGSATESFSFTGDYPALWVGCYSGVDATHAFDTSTEYPTGYQANLPSITPAQGDSLFLVVAGLGTAGATWGINSGFTSVDEIAFLAANHYGLAVFEKIKTGGSTSAEAPIVQNSGAAGPAQMHVFIPAAGGGAPAAARRRIIN